MEDPCLMTPNIERFFLNDKKSLDSLPILGTSALEQFLVQESERMRMSPDSTMNAVQIHVHNSNSINSDSSSNDQIPDSTTSDLNYDSDAFNSEDSCSSFAEAQQMAAVSGSTNFGNIFATKPFCEESNSSYEKPRKNAKKAKKAGDTLLKCEMCDYTTRFKEHLTSHMNTHKTTRNYMCSDCGQTFKWSHSLKRHQRTHAPSTDFRYTCHYCLKTFQRKDHLTIHESLHTSTGSNFPCSECGATFKNKKTLTGHIKTHTAEKAFKCNQCDSEFTRKASLNRHIRAAHTGVVLTCDLCPAVFSYRNTLEDHKKAAHNEGRREYGCDLCGVQFAVKAYLSKHMITCKNRAVGKSYPCGHCNKSFPTKRHLNDHNKRKHPNQQSASQQSAESQKSANFSAPQISNVPSQISQPQISQPPNPSFSTYDSSYYNYPQNNENFVKIENNVNHQLMGHDLPLPQMSNPPQIPQMSNTIIEEDHNVGSLLRLVYSSQDQLDSSHTSPISTNAEYQNNHSSSNHMRPHNQMSDLMDYSNSPILDGISLDYL